MKKNLFCTLIFILFIFIVSGCKNKAADLTLKEEISKEYEYYTKMKCSLKDNEILGLDFNGFYTKNAVYLLSLENNFSNEENCKEIKIENLDVNQILNISGSRVCTKVTCYFFAGKYIPTSYPNRNYSIFNSLGEKVLFYDNYIFKGKDAASPYKIVSVDNQIKLIKLKSSEEDTSITKIIDVESNFNYDEEVLHVNSRLIKTNKAYYYIKREIINKEECNKYADVSCKYNYKVIKDEVLTNNYNEILYAGYYIIDKDYNVYY